MAQQRRGQWRRHRDRGRAGGLGLGLLWTVLLTLGAAGCGGDADGSEPLGPGLGGGGGGTSTEPTVVGSWRNTTLIQVPGDLQRWTTTWSFAADGGCGQAVEIESLAEGTARITERTCAWSTASGEITIHYLGAGTLTFDFGFADFSPDRLVLDGFEYERLP